MDTPTFFAIVPRQIINYFDEELPYLCYISLNQGNMNTKTYMYYLDHFLWRAYVLLSTGQKVRVCMLLLRMTGLLEALVGISCYRGKGGRLAHSNEKSCMMVFYGGSKVLLT